MGIRAIKTGEPFVPGYHMRPIPKYPIATTGKILEEAMEAMDAYEQGNKIMEICELSDIYGALRARAIAMGFSMGDLERMADATARAFAKGDRV